MVVIARADDQEIRGGYLVLVERRTVHVVLDGLDRLPQMERSQERRRVGVDRFAVFVLRRSRILDSPVKSSIDIE